MDRDSLQAFIRRAKAEVEESVSDAKGVYDFADMEFRPQGDWRQASIYIFILETNGVIHFHGANMDLEGVSFWDREDNNGVKYTQDLISAAAMGGGFVEYLSDNPNVEGDEEDGSPKVGYAEELTFDDDKLVIGSGIYPVTPTPFAPPLAYVLLALLLAGAGYLRRSRR